MNFNMVFFQYVGDYIDQQFLIIAKFSFEILIYLKLWNNVILSHSILKDLSDTFRQQVM